MVTEASSDASEHDRLRRAAFNRGATAADLDALARFEAGRVAPVAAAPVAAASVGIAPTQTATVSESPAEICERRVTVRVLVWLVVLAFVLGGFGGWIAGGSGQSVRIDPLSSLSVFDGPHTAADDSRILGPMTIVVEGSAATTVTDIRHLRTVIGFALFGALGSKDIYGVATPMVCMSVESTNTGGMACVTRDEFVTKGVEVRTGTGGDLFGPTFHWGPVGPPMQLQVSDAGSS